MFRNIKNYFINSYGEMLKVTWPSRTEASSHTIIVILSILVAMGLVTVLDLGLFKLLQMLINK